MAKYMKDYLKYAEIDQYLTLRYNRIQASIAVREWEKANNLTEAEKRALEDIQEASDRFVNLLHSRLSEKSINELNKRVSRFEFKIPDQVQWERIFRKMGEALESAVMPREDYEDWCEQIMAITCYQCTKCHQDCRLHDVFYENLTPEPVKCALPNCRYAYDNNEPQTKVG